MIFFQAKAYISRLRRKLFKYTVQKTKYLAGIAKHGFRVGEKFLTHGCWIKPNVFFPNNLEV
jgi:hypothetical protein